MFKKSTGILFYLAGDVKMKYIGYYNSVLNKEDRSCVPSAVTKMDYIAETLVKNGEEVQFISNSVSLSGNYYRSKKLCIAEKISLKLFTCLPGTSKIMRIFSRWGVNMQMFVYLLLHVKKREKVIVYHSLGYMKMIDILHRLKKFYLILEVEEIYSDVNESLKKICDKERDYLKKADAYIFSTELLDEIVNIECKPSCIVYGTYKVKEPIDISEKNNDWEKDKLHIVYAGTFDRDKGGVDIAISAANDLPEEYHVHIIGFGTEKDIKRVKQQIAAVKMRSHCIITYDGLLLGEDYDAFIQQCDIGLSTQNPNSAFNSTSFPSKVLSYMANGLRVVSIKIPVLEIASIGKYLYYYEEQNSEKLAQTIKKIDFSIPYEGREVLKRLDLNFQQELKRMMEV